MTEFAHDRIKPFDNDASKREQVSTMFDKIAPRYDFMNRFLSAGIDISWRKKAIRSFGESRLHHLLDVATGTGDMSIMAAKLINPDHITGIDISPGMLEFGKKKIEKQELGTKIELRLGDAETINFPDHTFDGVMVAFGVRNFENLEKGLTEIRRVMKPGAKLVVLEFSRPVIPGVKSFYNFYMKRLAPGLAGMFRQDKKAYQYLNASANAFPDRQDFENILKRTGYTDTHWKPLSLGICCLYTGSKPA